MRVTSCSGLASGRSSRAPGGCAKKVTAQILLAMMARANPLIFILERGAS